MSNSLLWSLRTVFLCNRSLIVTDCHISFSSLLDLLKTVYFLSILSTFIFILLSSLYPSCSSLIDLNPAPSLSHFISLCLLYSPQLSSAHLTSPHLTSTNLTSIIFSALSHSWRELSSRKRWSWQQPLRQLEWQLRQHCAELSWKRKQTACSKLSSTGKRYAMSVCVYICGVSVCLFVCMCECTHALSLSLIWE